MEENLTFLAAKALLPECSSEPQVLVALSAAGQEWGLGVGPDTDTDTDPVGLETLDLLASKTPLLLIFLATTAWA